MFLIIICLSSLSLLTLMLCSHQSDWWHQSTHKHETQSHKHTRRATTSRPIYSYQGRAMLALCLFQFHLVRRALETASVMQYPPDALMHGIAYIFGLRCGHQAGYHHVCMVLHACMHACMLCTCFVSARAIYLELHLSQGPAHISMLECIAICWLWSSCVPFQPVQKSS